jgi:hypothetical protein
VIVFLASLEMFGSGAGFLSLALLVFEPNVIIAGRWQWLRRWSRGTGVVDGEVAKEDVALRSPVNLTE